MIQLNANHLLYLLEAARWTVLLSLIAFLGGAVVGLPLALMRLSKVGLLRALASDAIRGSLERHFGVTLAFQNCHRVAVFAADAAGTEVHRRFVSPRAQLLNQSPAFRDC